ncbi:Hypothetical Protein RradSPS_1237 [Rubrobacter radiotolerans]|uniref:DUF4199 domain-containing protein n=1 Tax=Rubrobacter radiotolerans TaxID=42256 RepID=A0A023X3C7_RUBRA|nr:hypothetical protein [Rubrobacter radiotolerans]AHY46520.1 Hypothetical Protein RradSPS_1237 [Rubrobacter radiotolerans]MDX5893927.1 hypothetical protein [Rubrobacter radiotolerans]SMC04778.1 conserved hypothetical protein [Rubrobacter radiotolerans DSM 5868]
MGPIRVGFFYGAIAVVIAVFSQFFFLFLDPVETTDWVLAALTDFLPLAALAAYIMLAFLAALRARPTYLESGVPYRSFLLRDAALAAALVGALAGLANVLSTAVQAIFLADEIRAFAADAAPRIAAYVNEVRQDLSDPPPPTSAEQIQRLLQPPEIRDLAQSVGNAAIGTMILGALGAFVGLLRGLAKRNSDDDGASSERTARN